MERNSEFYRTREKHMAFHPQPGLPDASQWWFHDAIFSNGYYMQLMFHFTPAKASIWFHICDSDGNLTHVTPVFHPSMVVASTETCDVRIGENRMFGKFPRYEIHFRQGDIGADLVYECLTQELFEPPDGVFIGREQCPATPQYMAWVFRPRSKITGKLIVAGKEIPVEGEGYADHQWQNASMGQFQNHYWYWGSLYLPKYTIIWWDTQLNQTFGFQRAKWLWALKGEKLFEYSSHADMYIELDNLEISPVTGVTYPRKMILMLDEPKIKGTAIYTVKQILQDVPISAFGVQLAPGQKVGLKHYYRYLSECHSEFEIEGERIVADTKQIHEIGV